MRRSPSAFALANHRRRAPTPFRRIQALAMSGSRVTGIRFMEGTSGVTVTGRVLRTEALTGPLRTIQVAATIPDAGKAVARPISTAPTRTATTTATTGGN